MKAIKQKRVGNRRVLDWAAKQVAYTIKYQIERNGKFLKSTVTAHNEQTAVIKLRERLIEQDIADEGTLRIYLQSITSPGKKKKIAKAPKEDEESNY